MERNRMGIIKDFLLGIFFGLLAIAILYTAAALYSLV